MAPHPSRQNVVTKDRLRYVRFKELDRPRSERRMPRLTAAAICLILLTPGAIKRRLLRWLFGWEIDRSATLGMSLFYNVSQVRMGPGSRIGHFNVLRNLRSVELKSHAVIGQWNWITAATMLVDPPYVPTSGCITINDEAAINSRHYLDCAGGIEVGAATTIAGVRSTILSHQIDVATSRQTAVPIRIGSYSFVGSNVLVTPGASIPDRCVIAMGATVVGRLSQSGMLYGGVPARPLKSVEGGKYFDREKGFVGR
jgi:acetyltransferase-like isoleucine patch superfamily enzyme